jgi:glyoxylase-like metal-dependent hydrolase (beta-lactamase superfamily II)
MREVIQRMEIAPGVYSMDQSKGGHVHAFLLDDGTELTLIDTLFDTDARRIIDRIEAIGRSHGNLKHIVLTHAHRSHLGGLATLKRLSGATDLDGRFSRSGTGIRSWQARPSVYAPWLGIGRVEG